MFERYSQTRPISNGIFYYTNERGNYFALSRLNLHMHKVIKNGFIIGVTEGLEPSHVLRPIYDKHRQMVIVRLRDYMNIPVRPFDVPNFNFHRQLPPSVDRGNMPPIFSSDTGYETQESDDETTHSHPRIEHGESSIQGSRRNPPQYRNR